MGDEIISKSKLKTGSRREISKARAAITRVEKGSLAERAGIQVGDSLLRINGHILEDIIDYHFLTADSYLELEVLKKDGSLYRVGIAKDEYEGLGLGFASPTFDPIRRCTNRCIFCFVHQLPSGFRDTLYVKDDDYRLSFLQGSFITLTNLREEDWRRIARLRLSPLYVSVHTTSPELRVKMLNNPAAAHIYDQLRRLASLRIEVHTQIVLCPGINDGEELRRTIDDLATLWPYVKSVGIVPVGLTRYRDGLYPLKAVTVDGAKEVIAYVEEKRREYKSRWGYSFLFLADEFYQLVDMPLPPSSAYEDFPQLENGIGLIRSFEDEFCEVLETIALPKEIPERHISIVTGVAGAPVIRRCMRRLGHIKGFNYMIHVVRNRTFGDTITVTGLLTGRDIFAELQGRELGERLLIPSVMVREDDNIFLDDMRVEELEKALNTPIMVVKGVSELLGVALGLEVK